MTNKKIRVGIVVSDAMEKTVAVRVERTTKDPKYGKYIRRHKKYLAHDENNNCKVGDRIEMIETRPLSKRKRWRVTKVLEQGTLTSAVKE